MRYAQVEVVHTTIDGEPRVQLRTVIEGGDEVMTAIGSDIDTGGTGDLEWTSMRAALLLQLRTAMEALGWQEIGTGPAWWQVRFSGGPEARIPVIEPTTEATGQSGAPTTATDQPPSPPPGPGQGTADLNDVNYLVSLIGKRVEDPEVAKLVRLCGTLGKNLHSNLACQDQGLELTLGSGLQVVDVTIYAEEPGTYGEYMGALPLGLTWDDSYYDILDKLGEPDRRVGGGGVTINLQYPAGDAWVLLITSATHDRPEYLENARLMSVQLTKRPQLTFPKPDPVDTDWSD